MKCNGKRPLKKCCYRKWVSNKKTKNEQVVGRNIIQRARPCKGAKLTPGLWIGGTKEVRTHEVMILVDTGGAQP